MTYAKATAVQVDPIEKKPLNHFMPGSQVFSIGTASCNFGCLFCQNHEISKDSEIAGADLSPEEAVRLALQAGAQGIAYTYNEPAIFIEYALDTARLAKKEGLFNVFVTNGYLGKESVKAMKGQIDAAVVSYKGSGDPQFAGKYEAVPSPDPIRETLLALKKAGIHTELTDLVIPRVGESSVACEEMARWINGNLGPDTPLQFLAFHPDYKMLDFPATPYGTLKAHYDIAKKAGLRYVYIGNSPGNPFENTYCPNCGGIVIGRHGYSIDRRGLTQKNRCASCGSEIFMRPS
jgi:pyruvate formate lyase activating enzyme